MDELEAAAAMPAIRAVVRKAVQAQEERKAPAQTKYYSQQMNYISFYRHLADFL